MKTPKYYFFLTIPFLFLIITCKNTVSNKDLKPSEMFVKNYGGGGHDFARFVQQTTDEGYIIAGSTESIGNGLSDFWLIKTDSEGNEDWNQTYGGVEDEWGSSAQQTSDGGYIITGNTKSFGNGGWDFLLIKTDSEGNDEWSQTFGGEEDEESFSVQQTTDGGYIITGYTNSIGNGGWDFLLIKTDSEGNEDWNQTYGGAENDYARFAQQTIDEGYIITGNTRSYGIGNSDIWLIKTDSGGNEEWNQTFGGVGNDYAYFTQQTFDGGYVIAGHTKSFGNGLNDIWLIKTDSGGNEEWNQTFGGVENEWGRSVKQTSDDGYIIAGSSKSIGDSLYDIWLIKTDSGGNEEWNQTFGGVENDYGNFVQQTTDEGYIIIGDTESFGNGLYDVWLIKTDSDGNTISFGN